MVSKSDAAQWLSDIDGMCFEREGVKLTFERFNSKAGESFGFEALTVIVNHPELTDPIKGVIEIGTYIDCDSLEEFIELMKHRAWSCVRDYVLSKKIDNATSNLCDVANFRNYRSAL